MELVILYKSFAGNKFLLHTQHIHTYFATTLTIFAQHLVYRIWWRRGHTTSKSICAVYICNRLSGHSFGIMSSFFPLLILCVSLFGLFSSFGFSTINYESLVMLLVQASFVSRLFWNEQRYWVKRERVLMKKQTMCKTFFTVWNWGPNDKIANQREFSTNFVSISGIFLEWTPDHNKHTLQTMYLCMLLALH